ncbi:class I SAM-dependent methyltransferase [Gloeobacter violaceus]|uniref:Gll0338 protein n=1 Tax=Gloeobacter violaceus (strain ATCC 29082 / PCC 7421) TaxID=251221 RepID=Q7NNS2_GLOVI|nr:class I SAM-dependent methyltransferase [Gloeobacter violaceus]BAC88279.1 gll0338 [Gloeobacter violaceus PCC 7421]
MPTTKVQLGAVQETLLIPLWARAAENNQPDPILRDPKSAEILGQIDYDFSKLAKAEGTQMGCCMRGWLFDRWVSAFLAGHPDGIVVEIGCGLNTRFERVDNGRVLWFDLDLPDAMALRGRFFEPTDRRRFIAASALDPAWVEIVNSAGPRPVLFVAEAVLIYLSEAQVRQFLALVAEHFAGALLAFDSMAPSAVKNQHRHEVMRYYNARFQWGIRDIRAIESWDSRYRVLESCTFWDVPKRYHRRVPLLMRLLYSLPPLNNAYRLSLVRLGRE